MPGKLAILVCSTLLEEARRALPITAADDVKLYSFASACSCVRQSDDAAIATGIDLAARDFEVHVIGGSCFGMGDPVGSLGPGVILHRVNPCAALFVSTTVVDRWVHEGAYLITPGWLRDWKQRLRKLGFEPDGARQFFQESVTRIVLVDTLDDPASQNELRELAEFLGMPAEVAACGVDLFAALLGTIVESWRWRCERRELETIQAAANRRLGDYGLVHDTLGRLVTIQSETELVAVMFELFSMLFAPESIVYRPVHRGERGEAVRWPEDAPADDGESAEFVVSGEESASIGSNTGLALRFCHMAETLAVVELRQVACPQYQEHYLALGVTLAQLCGLAVANARNYQALQHLAGTDELTGLSNRRRFFALAQHQFMLARRHAYRLCVIMFDIDHFKKVNDTYGHAMGDRVLRKVARTCEGSVRATDLMGRYGGEEFVVLLHETDAAGARVAAERMRASVEALVFETPQGTLRVTISLGVAESAPGRELDAEIARADAALYQAKGQGRNRLCCAESWADPL